ncbi:MAG TPA: PKD domain-containing protein, partial [bacterium]|nr:PKD domain-containing protein [bacterium]
QPEGTTVVFTVTATGGSPPYSSVFSLPGGGGTILSQGVMSATVLLGSAGTYQGQVVVSDGTETANTNFPFEVDPLIPVVTGVTPTGAAGLPLGEVEFEAAIDGAYDTVTWDFGAGAEILSQTGNTARVRLLNPGNYTVRVFAENSNGRGDPLEFGYVVELPVEPPWNILEFGEASEVGFPGTSMVLADDRLAVAFNSGSGLKLLRALVENPMGPADFTETVIDPDGAINGAHSLASRSNELYVVYYKFNAGTGEYDSLWFARALTGNPTGPADWVRYQLAAPAYMTGYGEALAAFEEGVVWGSAATTPSSPGKAVLVVSWLADPGSSTGIGDWSQHEVAIPDASVAGACEFRLVEGTLYALMTKFSSENTGGIWLARSLSYPPEGPEDWEPFPIDNQGEFGLAQGATAIINGRFAVLYQRG